VPKCEIFDRSNFHDFYTIKSLWEGDFGVKIKKCFLLFRVYLGARNSTSASAQYNFRNDFFLLWAKKFVGKLLRPEQLVGSVP
jgi:hypothetical protein